MCIRDSGYTYYIAKALADKVLGSLAEEGKAAYEVLETYVGKDMEYKVYEPLYKCAGDAACLLYTSRCV